MFVGVLLLAPARRLCNARVCLFVCLSVCRTDLYENFTRDVSEDKEELSKFWKSCTFGYRYGNFLRILKHCEIGLRPKKII